MKSLSKSNAAESTRAISDSADAASADTTLGDPVGSNGGPRHGGHLLRMQRDIGIDRYGGVYLLVVMAVAFSLWEPSTFGTFNNAKAILSEGAITGIVALGAAVALIAGVFDLSIAANMSVAISLVGKLQASAHLSPILAVIVTLAAGGTIGCVNAVVVTRFHIGPVIATLATSSVLEAIAYWIASGQTILNGMAPGFISAGNLSPLGFPISVYVLAAVALALWYLLEHTPPGRYLYAAGANPSAARLSGVNVVRLQFSALIVSGVLASLAGVVLTMQLGAASFDAGDPYLLPAYAAAFLGATQIKPGRVNVLGTIVALYLIGAAVKGLQLKYPQYPWIQDLVEGLVLLVAVGIAESARRRRLRR